MALCVSAIVLSVLATQAPGQALRPDPAPSRAALPAVDLVSAAPSEGDPSQAAFYRAVLLPAVWAPVL
jgi:hypothetical protein